MCMQEPVLTALAGQLRGASHTSRSVGALSRLVVGLCPHVHPRHEPALIDSGFVDALLQMTCEANVSHTYTSHMSAMG